MTTPDPKDLRIVRLEALLSSARDSLADGLETEGELEAEHSIHARKLVADIDAALARPVDMTLGEIGLIDVGQVRSAETLAPIYGPGKYAFRVGDLPEAAMSLPNMQSPDTLIEFFAADIAGAHDELRRYLIQRKVFPDGALAPPVARYKPNNIRKRDRKN